MRRAALILLLVLAAATLVPPAATAAPTRCEGAFYGILATCMFRLGGSNLIVYGAAYGSDNPPAQIVVELLKWPASDPDDLLARCDTDGGVLQVCHKQSGAGLLAPNTMLLCRISGIGVVGAFGCATF